MTQFGLVALFILRASPAVAQDDAPEPWTDWPAAPASDDEGATVPSAEGGAASAPDEAAPDENASADDSSPSEDASTDAADAPTPLDAPDVPADAPHVVGVSEGGEASLVVEAHEGDEPPLTADELRRLRDWLERSERRRARRRGAQVDIAAGLIPVDNAHLLGEVRVDYHIPDIPLLVGLRVDAIGFARIDGRRIVPFLPHLAVGYDTRVFGASVGVGIMHLRVLERTRRGSGYVTTFHPRIRLGAVDGAQVRFGASTARVDGDAEYLNVLIGFRAPISEDLWFELDGSGHWLARYARVRIGARYRVNPRILVAGYTGYGRVQPAEDRFDFDVDIDQGLLFGVSLEVRRPPSEAAPSSD